MKPSMSQAKGKSKNVDRVKQRAIWTKQMDDMKGSICRANEPTKYVLIWVSGLLGESD